MQDKKIGECMKRARAECPSWTPGYVAYLFGIPASDLRKIESGQLEMSELLMYALFHTAINSMAATDTFG